MIRCTQKLLKGIGPQVADPPGSTTALGDWYAGHWRSVINALCCSGAKRRASKSVAVMGTELSGLSGAIATSPAPHAHR